VRVHYGAFTLVDTDEAPLFRVPGREPVILSRADICPSNSCPTTGGWDAAGWAAGALLGLFSWRTGGGERDLGPRATAG
jgi:hypothetical protein